MKYFFLSLFLTVICFISLATHPYEKKEEDVKSFYHNLPDYMPTIVAGGLIGGSIGSLYFMHKRRIIMDTLRRRHQHDLDADFYICYKITFVAGTIVCITIGSVCGYLIEAGGW